MTIPVFENPKFGAANGVPMTERQRQSVQAVHDSPLDADALDIGFLCPGSTADWPPGFGDFHADA